MSGFCPSFCLSGFSNFRNVSLKDLEKDFFPLNFDILKEKIFFRKKRKNSNKFGIEISQKLNLSFGDSILVNHETIRKTSLLLKNIEKKTSNSGFCRRLVLILHGLKL